MATVSFKGATRIYPGNPVPAVDRLDLDISDGEFMVLVGPSGSGKSTALRMLAGLEDVNEGAIFIGDRDVTHWVHEAAKLLGREEYLDRKPKALSGGQRKRVAIGASDRSEPARVPDGRATVQPGRQAPGRDANPDRPAAAPTRRHDGLRHARSGRGHDDGRPRRGARTDSCSRWTRR